jgi:hypothetical protein
VGVIKRTHIVLQSNADGEWRAVDNFTDAEAAARCLAQMPDEDPWNEYRLQDRSYEIPDRHAGDADV